MSALKAGGVLLRVRLGKGAAGNIGGFSSEHYGPSLFPPSARATMLTPMARMKQQERFGRFMLKIFGQFH